MKKLLLFVSVLSLCSADVFGMHPGRGITKAKNGQGVFGFGRTGKVGRLPVSGRRLRRGGVVQLNETHLDELNKLNKEDLVSMVMQLNQKNGELTENLEARLVGINNVISKNKQLKSTAASYASENNQLKSVAEYYASENNQLRSTAASYASENNQLKSVAEYYASENNKLKSINEELTKNLETEKRNREKFSENLEAAQRGNKYIVSENDRLTNIVKSYTIALTDKSHDIEQIQSCIDDILLMIGNEELTKACQRVRGNIKEELELLIKAVKNSFDILYKQNEDRKKENEDMQSRIAFLEKRLSALEAQRQEENNNRVSGENSVFASGGGNESTVLTVRNQGVFTKNTGVSISGNMTSRDEGSTSRNQQDLEEMQDVMSDNNDSISEQFAKNSDCMAVEGRSVDLGEKCSYSGDFEGDQIHGMGTFHHGRYAFDISGSFVHGCLDLTKPITFKGCDGTSRKFLFSTLPDNKDLKIEVKVLMAVQDMYYANSSLCLIPPQGQSEKKEGIIFNEGFVYEGGLDDNYIPRGEGVMIKSTGKIIKGNFPLKSK